MLKSKNNLYIFIFFILLYFGLKYFIPFWNYIIYPFTLIVTFLHEFWHSFFAIITWWGVKWVQINWDGSGYAITYWWIRSFVLMWWYIGSAIFWNLLLYIWFKKTKLAQNIIYFLSFLMLFVSIFWFNSISSSLILILFSISLFYLAKKTKYDSLFLQLLWIFSILYIIQDFYVWPSSDLAKFSHILPTSVWMIIWLLIVLVITWYNLKIILKK